MFPDNVTETYSLVAVCGQRNGYLQLATRVVITDYQDIPPELLQGAQAWMQILQDCGAKRVYWIMLSEVLRHLHIHLYPRWTDDEPRGLALFEQRDEPLQPLWTPNVQAGLSQWAERHHCYYQ